MDKHQVVDSQELQELFDEWVNSVYMGILSTCWGEDHDNGVADLNTKAKPVLRSGV